MSLRQKYLNVVSQLVTPGAVGAALLLGTAVPAAASQEPAARQPAAESAPVSERLAAIRDAVSAVAGSQAQAPQSQRLAWGNWGGGWGWGRPFGGYGYGSPWSNWNNWRNGWHNWGNGWGNW